MFFGFERKNGKWRDVVPSVFQTLSKKELYEIFINQYNFCVDVNERINIKANDRTLSLFEVFKNEISLKLKCGGKLSPFKFKSFDARSAVLASLFESGEFEKLSVVAREIALLPKFSWAMLIFRIFSNENAGLVFEAKKLFADFVLEKISRKNPDKNVYSENGLIVIEKDGERLLSVMPCLKEFDKDKMHSVFDEINEAWKTLLSSRAKSLYIVFPRNDAFRRHIEVKNPCFADLLVKLIPYSIKFRREKCQ